VAWNEWAHRDDNAVGVCIISCDAMTVMLKDIWDAMRHVLMQGRDLFFTCGIQGVIMDDAMGPVSK
jgi:hypothetical protein